MGTSTTKIPIPAKSHTYIPNNTFTTTPSVASKQLTKPSNGNKIGIRMNPSLRESLQKSALKKSGVSLTPYKQFKDPRDSIKFYQTLNKPTLDALERN